MSPHGIGDTLTTSNLSEHLFTKKFTLIDYEGQSLDEYYIDQSGVAYNGIVVDTESEGYIPYDHAKYMWINRENSIASVYGNTLGASVTTFAKMSNGSFKVYNRTTQGFEERATVTLPSAVFQILGEETYAGITYYKVTRMWSALFKAPLTFPFYIAKDLTAFNYVSDDTYYSIRRETSYIIMAKNTPQGAVVPYTIQSVLSVVEATDVKGRAVTYENPSKTLFVVTRASENSPSFYIDSHGFYRWEDFDGVAISDRLVAKEDSTELSSLVDGFSKAVYLDSPLAVDLDEYFANEPQDPPKGFDASYNKAVPYGGDHWNNDVWCRGALQMTHHAVMKVTQTFQNPQRTIRWYYINDAGYVRKEGSTALTSAWVYSIVSDQGLEGTMAPVEEYTKEDEWGTLDPPVEVVFLEAISRTGQYLPKLPNGISQPVMVSRTVWMPRYPFPYYFVEYDGQKIVIRPSSVSDDYAPTFRQEECDLYISPDRVHKTVFGCAYEYTDPYEGDLVSDVIRTRGYHCKRRLEANSYYIYQVQVYTRTTGTSEAVPVMAWCNGYEVRDVPLVQEFNVSGTLNNPLDIYMYNDARTRVLGHDSDRSPQVTCLGRTANGMVKIRYISMGQEREGYVLERNVTMSETIEPIENPERITNPHEGHYTLRVLSYRPENDNQDLIANLWISMNDPELLSMVSQEAPTNVYPVYTDVTLEEVIDGLGKLSLKQQLTRCKAGAEFVIIDSTGNAINLSSVDSPYSYTLQFLSFSDRSGCLNLFYAFGIDDPDSSDMCEHTPCGVYSYINTTLELATQAFNSLESWKRYYDPRAVFCVLDKDGNMVLPVGGLYSVRLRYWDSNSKISCINLIITLNGSSSVEAEEFLNNCTEPTTVPGLENLTYSLALGKYNLAVNMQEIDPSNCGCSAVFDIIDYRGVTVYPTE